MSSIEKSHCRILARKRTYSKDQTRSSSGHTHSYHFSPPQRGQRCCKDIYISHDLSEVQTKMTHSALPYCFQAVASPSVTNVGSGICMAGHNIIISGLSPPSPPLPLPPSSPPFPLLLPPPPPPPPPGVPRVWIRVARP